MNTATQRIENMQYHKEIGDFRVSSLDHEIFSTQATVSRVRRRKISIVLLSLIFCYLLFPPKSFPCAFCARALGSTVLEKEGFLRFLPLVDVTFIHRDADGHRSHCLGPNADQRRGYRLTGIRLLRNRTIST
jgi:hypothetical protein